MVDQPITIMPPEVWQATEQAILKAVAAEREACAVLAETFASMAANMGDTAAWRALLSVADAIRNRRI